MRHPEHNFLEDEQKVSRHGNPQYTGNSSVSCYPGWLAWETARDLEILSLPWRVLEWTLRPVGRGAVMNATVKATYSNGTLTPLTPLNLEEGEEVTVTVHKPTPTSGETPTINNAFYEAGKSLSHIAMKEDGPTYGARDYERHLRERAVESFRQRRAGWERASFSTEEILAARHEGHRI